MAQPSTATHAVRERHLAMTYDEWLAWTEDSTQSEWVDGEAIVFVPPTTLHQDALGLLYILLRLFTRSRGLGRVVQAPFEMRLSDRSSREPDILFVARANLDRLTPQRLIGPADLAIEVISDDSVTRDRVEKLNEYAAAGIREYWVFDPRPRRRTTEFLRLTDDRRYEAMAPDADGRHHSLVLPGFWLRPAWLWQDPQPDPLDCLEEIAPEVRHGRRARVGEGEG